jgi:predicted ATPase with chaperone activity
MVSRDRTMNTPQTVDQLDIPRKLLEDLALKTLYVMGELTLYQLAQHMCIGLAIVEQLFQRLRRDQLCQVTGMVGGVHQIVPTSEGRTRALELLTQSQYAGPAPVSLNDYVERTREQTVRRLDIHEPEVQKAFAHLVLDRTTLGELGTAVVSGRALFLYGPAGTGKTSVAEALWSLLRQDAIWIPHAVAVDGQIISVYDPHVHQAVEDHAPSEFDRRWVRCERPRVVVGGELTVEMLDLQFNPHTKFYAGPVQMKSNNGLLIVDDFGRQRARPEELLNRWVVPLDRSIDFLTLAGGKKIEVPFDMLVVFATNLDPSTLVDEAFLRRIQTKIRLDNVTPPAFHEICRRVCTDAGVGYDAAVVSYLIDRITRELEQPLRACYPRDIIQQICWTARYEQRAPRLDRQSVEQACRAYFLTPDSYGLRAGPHRASPSGQGEESWASGSAQR